MLESKYIISPSSFQKSGFWISTFWSMLGEKNLQIIVFYFYLWEFSLILENSICFFDPVFIAS